MSNAPSLSGKKMVAVLQSLGYEVKRVTGSHHILSKAGSPIVTVPVHRNKSLATGTQRSIQKSAGLSDDDLINLLNR